MSSERVRALPLIVLFVCWPDTRQVVYNFDWDKFALAPQVDTSGHKRASVRATDLIGTLDKWRTEHARVAPCERRKFEKRECTHSTKNAYFDLFPYLLSRSVLACGPALTYNS